jgi:hypothetical protein
MRLSIGLAAAGLMTVCAIEIGRTAVGVSAAGASERAEGVTRSKAKTTKSTSSNRSGSPDGLPRFGRPARYNASFAGKLYARAYTREAFVANPVASAEYRATPEYDYLYTGGLIASSPPAPSSHRYAADNSYLLRPSLGRNAVALVYRWRSCTSVGLTHASRTTRFDAPDWPAISRNRGQKIDHSLNLPASLAGHPGALGGVSGPKLQLGEVIQPSPLTSSGTHRPCVTVR